MKRIFNSIFMSISMFTIFPTPNFKWDKKDAPLSLCFFPFICGGLIFICFYIIANFIKKYISEPLILGTIYSFLWFFLNGFLHIDGFCDICDALFSRTEQEKKLKILKDPHIGSFATVSLIFVIIFTILSFYIIVKYNLKLAYLLFILFSSRSVTGTGLFLFPTIKISSLGEFFKTDKMLYKIFLEVTSLAILFTSFYMNKKVAFILAIGLISSTFSLKILNKNFIGINGDCIGFTIVLSETIMLFLYGIIGGIL